MESESTALIKAVTGEIEELRQYHDLPGVHEALVRILFTVADLPPTGETLMAMMYAAYDMGIHVGKQVHTLENMGL